MNIGKNTSLKDLAIIVCTHLQENGIKAVLVGGAVVTIYTNEKYESYDLDFITHAERKKVESAMRLIGFEKQANRYFKHPKTKFFIEFPTPPLAIGEESVTTWTSIRTNLGTLHLFTATQCVMDRLCAFYHWNDFQSLKQALAVAKMQKINLQKIKRWSLREGMKEKLELFLRKLIRTP